MSKSRLPLKLSSVLGVVWELAFRLNTAHDEDSNWETDFKILRIYCQAWLDMTKDFDLDSRYEVRPIVLQTTNEDDVA